MFGLLDIKHMGASSCKWNLWIINKSFSCFLCVFGPLEDLFWKELSSSNSLLLLPPCSTSQCQSLLLKATRNNFTLLKCKNIKAFSVSVKVCSYTLCHSSIAMEHCTETLRDKGKKSLGLQAFRDLSVFNASTILWLECDCGPNLLTSLVWSSFTKINYYS